MTLYLVRHAKAGDRSRWPGDDTLRPLSKSGRAQADALATRLAPLGIARVVSSPALRCRETLDPLASTLGLDVEIEPCIAEGAETAPALALVESAAATAPVAVCSHGDVIGELLGHWSRHGVPLEGIGLQKGSVWVVEFTAGAAIRARYLPPA
jgi:8-oxo-dGTP diphosphatase